MLEFQLADDVLLSQFENAVSMSKWLQVLCDTIASIAPTGASVITHYWYIPHTKLVIMFSAVKLPMDCYYTFSVKENINNSVHFMTWHNVFGVSEIVKVSENTEFINQAYECWKLFKDLRIRELEGFSV